MPSTPSQPTRSAGSGFPGPHSYDVIVVGAGAAGLSAAIFAAKAGAKTLVVERSQRVGGTSALSGGWMWLPGASRSEAARSDSREQARAYVEALAGEHFRPDIVDAFLDSAPETLQALEGLGLKLVHAEAAPDYEEDAPGAVRGGRAISADSWSSRKLGRKRHHIRRPLKSMTVFGVVPQIGVELDNFVRANQSVKSFVFVASKIAAATFQRILFGGTTRLTNGNSLVGQLYRIALDAGVGFMLDARVESLASSQDGSAEVAVDSPWGSLRLAARGGVVLACGGISHDEATTSLHFPHVGEGLRHHSVTTAEHDGEALRLAKPFDASFTARVGQPAAWAPVTVFGRGGSEIFPHLRSIGLPGLIAVNRDGRRFTNEADSYHAFGQSLIADAHGRDEAGAVLIADAHTMRKYGIGYAKPFPIPRFAYYRKGYLSKGRSLDAIARDFGMDAETLRQTVAEYNADAERGTDSRFGRGSTFYNRFRGDKNHEPNPSVGPIGAGPYFAAPIVIGDLGAFAGLDVDGRSRVLDASGAPFEWLFAAGTAAVSPFGGGYPGYGAMLGPAMVMGAVAGKQAAERASAGD